MAETKRPRGRPVRPLPPRIDADAETVARAVLRMPKSPPAPRTYRCVACGQSVQWPAVLHDDQRCENCHASS